LCPPNYLLNTYATGFFNSTAVNAIVSTGTTIGKYFTTELAKIASDKNKAEIDAKDSQGNVVIKAYFDRITGTGEWDLMGYENYDGSFYGYGDLKATAAKELKYYDAELRSRFGSDIAIQNLKNGYQTYAEIKNSTGKTILVIEPNVQGGYNYYDSYGAYMDAKIKDYMNYKEYTLKDNYISSYKELNGEDYRTILEIAFSGQGTSLMMDFKGLALTESDLYEIGDLSTAEKQGLTHIFYYNGIGNPNPAGVASGYLHGLAEQMAIADESVVQNTFIASFENSPSVIDKAQNCWAWYKDARNITLNPNEITDHIIAQMVKKYGSILPADMLGLAYSGDGDSLLQGLNQHPNIDMKTIGLIGTPLYETRRIDNPNVESLMIFVGEDDWVAKDIKDCGIGKTVLEHDFTGSNTNFALYKFELKNVNHFEYTYDPEEEAPNPIATKAARFIAEAISKANYPTLLQQFFRRNPEGIIYDENRKIYKIDLEKVKYEE